MLLYHIDLAQIYKYIKVMDNKTVQLDVKNNKIREGVLYKRSKFLKEWRERWIVLTTNFLYTFTNKKMEELTDVIDLKEIKSYKSYLRKDQEMIPPGFKVRSAEDMYYFCARNCNEKWSWLVSLERLMDLKYVGASNYNNMEWIKTKGFDSQIDFQNGGSKITSVEMPQQKIKSNDKAVDEEAQKILKQLQEQQKELNKKKEELEKKEANFVMEQKKQQEEKKVQQPSPTKKVEPVMQKRESQDDGNSKVSQLRNMFQNRISESQQNVTPKYETQSKPKKINQKKQQSLHSSRSRVINGLFQQFRKDSFELFGLKYVMDFIVNVTADERMGYSSHVIIQGKSNPNKQNFADAFIQLLSIYEDYQNCENLMRFIETCVFQLPGLFDAMQIARIQKKLKDFFAAVNNENKLEFIVKNMFIMHKLCRYQKQDIHSKLDKLVKQVKNENTRNWSKKLRDDL